MERRDHIASLIRSAGSPQTARLLARAARATWPGGAHDRTQPTAREWVRRWRPRHPVTGADIPACACAGGRCAICN
jgi:hypothetical protein